MPYRKKDVVYEQSVFVPRIIITLDFTFGVGDTKSGKWIPWWHFWWKGTSSSSATSKILSKPICRTSTNFCKVKSTLMTKCWLRHILLKCGIKTHFAHVSPIHGHDPFILRKNAIRHFFFASFDYFPNIWVFFFQNKHMQNRFSVRVSLKFAAEVGGEILVGSSKFVFRAHKNR